MNKVKTYGSIRAGSLAISHRDRFVKSLATWPDCRVIVTVEKVVSKHTDPQRAYYHGVVVNEFMLGFKDTTGETIDHDRAHDALKLRCNGKEFVNEQTGEIITVPGSTKRMTKTEYAEYVDECIKFIFTWTGRIVPAPGDQTKMEFK